jgi:succinate dehydrogenase/fumarate reductase cytochrome b subunit
MKHFRRLLDRLTAVAVLLFLAYLMIGWMAGSGGPSSLPELWQWLSDRPEIIAAIVLGGAILGGAYMIANSRARQEVDAHQDQRADHE